MSDHQNLSAPRFARLWILTGLLAVVFAITACSSDEESRQWYVNEFERTNSFTADEARCYVDGVADEFGVHALNPERAVSVAGRVRIVAIQNECRGSAPSGAVAFAGPELPDSSDERDDAEVDDSEIADDDLPAINYNRRKNVIKRLKTRLGLSAWNASCLIDTVMAETDRQIVTWAAAPPKLQNEVLARCLGADNDD